MDNDIVKYADGCRERLGKKGFLKGTHLVVQHQRGLDLALCWIALSWLEMLERCSYLDVNLMVMVKHCGTRIDLILGKRQKIDSSDFSEDIDKISERYRCGCSG